MIISKDRFYSPGMVMCHLLILVFIFPNYPLTPSCIGGGHATLKHWSASPQRFSLLCDVMLLLFRDINLYLYRTYVKLVKLQ